MPTQAVRKLLQRLEVDDPRRAALAEELDPHMLDLWAQAEARLAEPDPRWAEFQKEGWNQDPGEIERLAKGVWPQRWAAVLNPNTPGKVLEGLTADPIFFIAAVASSRLNTQVSPLPRPVRFSTDYPDSPFFLGYNSENYWLDDLRLLQAEVRAGQLAYDQAVRFAACLPGSWIERQIQGLGEEESVPEQELELRKDDPALLIDYAHALPTYGWADDDFSGATGLLEDLLHHIGILLSIPVHGGFTDEELSAWLARSAMLEDEQQSAFREVLVSRPEGWETASTQNAVPFPGGAFWWAVTDNMPASDVSFILEGSFPREATGSGGLEKILEVVWPGLYRFE